MLDPLVIHEILCDPDKSTCLRISAEIYLDMMCSSLDDCFRVKPRLLGETEVYHGGRIRLLVKP